jgi:hypothetical protein
MSRQKGASNKKSSSDESAMRERRGVCSIDCVTSPKSYERDGDFDSMVISDLSFDFSKSVSGNTEVQNQALYEILTEYLVNGTAIGEQLRAYLSSDDEDESSCGSDDQSNRGSFLSISVTSSQSQCQETTTPILSGVEKRNNDERRRGRASSLEKRRGMLAKKLQHVIDTQLSSVTKEVEADASRQSRWHVFNRSRRPMKQTQRNTITNLPSLSGTKRGNEDSVHEKQLSVDVHDLPLYDETFVSTVSAGRKLVNQQIVCPQDLYCSITPRKTPITLENIVAMMDRILKEEKKRLTEMKKVRRLQRMMDDNKESLEIKVENAMVKAGCLVSPLSSTHSETEIVFGEANSFEIDDGLWNNQHLWERFSPINTKCWHEPDTVQVTSDRSVLSSDGVGSLLFQAEIPVLSEVKALPKNQEFKNNQKEPIVTTSGERLLPDEGKIDSTKSSQGIIINQSPPTCSSKHHNGFEVTELSSGENALRFIWNVEEESSQIVELQSGYPHKLTKTAKTNSKDIVDDMTQQKSKLKSHVTKPSEETFENNRCCPPLHVNLTRNVLTKSKTRQRKNLEQSIMRSLSATEATCPSRTESRPIKESKDKQENSIFVTLFPMTQSIGTPLTRLVPEIHSFESPHEKTMVPAENSLLARKRSDAVEELLVQKKEPQTPFVKLKKIRTADPIASTVCQPPGCLSRAKMSKSRRKTNLEKRVSFASSPDVLINDGFSSLKNCQEKFFTELPEGDPKLTEAVEEHKVDLEAPEKLEATKLSAMREDVSIITIDERDEIELFCNESPRRRPRFALGKNITMRTSPKKLRLPCSGCGANEADIRPGKHNSGLTSTTLSVKVPMMTQMKATLNGKAKDESFSLPRTAHKQCETPQSEGSISVSPSHLRFMWTSRSSNSSTLKDRKVKCFGLRRCEAPKSLSPNLTIQVDNETEQPYCVQPIPRTAAGLQEEKDFCSSARFILRPTKFWKKKIEQAQNNDALHRSQPSDNVSKRNRDNSMPSMARKLLHKRTPAKKRTLVADTQANASSSISRQKSDSKPQSDQNVVPRIVKAELRGPTRIIKGNDRGNKSKKTDFVQAQNAGNVVPFQGPLHQESLFMATSAVKISAGNQENDKSKPNECTKDLEISCASKTATRTLKSSKNNESIKTCNEYRSSSEKIHQSGIALRRGRWKSAKGNEDQINVFGKIAREYPDKTSSRSCILPNISIIRGSKREEEAKDNSLDIQRKECQTTHLFRRKMSKFPGLSIVKKCNDLSNSSKTKVYTACRKGGSSETITLEPAELAQNGSGKSPPCSLPERRKISALFDCDVSEDEVLSPQDKKKRSNQILAFDLCRDESKSSLHSDPRVQEKQKNDTSQRNRNRKLEEVNARQVSLNESFVQAEKLVVSSLENKVHLPVHKPERRIPDCLTRNRVAFSDDPVVVHVAKFSPLKSSLKLPPPSALKYKCKTTQQSSHNMHIDKEQLREVDNASSTSSTDEESLGAVNKSAKILWRLSEASKQKKSAQSKPNGLAIADVNKSTKILWRLSEASKREKSAQSKPNGLTTADDCKEHGSCSSIDAESQHTSTTDWSLVSSASRLSSAEKKLAKRLTNDLKILKRIERKRTILGLEKSHFKTADIENSLTRLKSLKQCIQDRNKSSVSEICGHAVVDIENAVSLSTETNSILTKEKDSSTPLPRASRK